MTTTPDVALDAARQAARAVADYQRAAARTRTERDLKRDKYDIVTEHDRRCEQIATAALRELLPGCQIVGEEYGTSDADPDGVGADVTCFVDPIDGTSNFVSGLPLFAVSIGVAAGELLIAGVVNAPLLGYEFYAADGLGAWLESWDEVAPVRLGTRVERPAQECLVLTGFPSARDVALWGAEGADVMRRYAPEFMSVRNIGTSALEICFTAAGWVDGCIGTGAGPWDLAGGLMVAREAGCTSVHRALRGANGPLPWEHPGYGVIAPARDLPQVELVLDELQRLAPTD